MIRDYQKNRITAKQYARIQLMAAIGAASAYVYDDHHSELTQAEKDEVMRFIKKDADRCARLLGFEESDQA